MAPVGTPALVTPDVISSLGAFRSVDQSCYVPVTLIDVLSHAAEWFSMHELSFIPSTAHDLFKESLRNLVHVLAELNKPVGTILAYLTEQNNMDAVWACLLDGCVPWLQPALSAQQVHKVTHIAHITNSLGW